MATLTSGVIPNFVGSPQTVVDQMEQWIDIGGVDGFNLAHVTNPGSFEDMAQFLLPELERRGLFSRRVDKEGATARERFLGQSHVLEDHPAYQCKWHVT